MEITLEQVEKVRSCTGVSYEEAKMALEACSGSVLDAVILLEQRGKVKDGPAGYSTRAPEPEPAPERGRRAPDWPEVRRALRSLVTNCLSITLEVWKTDRPTCVMPLLAAVILCVIKPQVMGVLFVIGLCFGYRIHLSGRGTEDWGEKLNQGFDRMGDTVHDAVSSLRKKGKHTR